MNDLYAVDPKAPSSLSELSSLVRLFSPSEGRYIVDFPMGWTSEVKEHMSSLSDLCRMATVEAWIKLSGHAILPTKHQYKSSLTWAENATYIRSDVVKLIGPSGISKNPVEPIDHALMDPNAFRDSRSALIPRTANAYADVARPILLRSPKVVLIDPFLTLRHRKDSSHPWREDRRRNVVKAMLKVALQGKFLECFEIRYVPENNVEGTDYLDEDLKTLADEIGFTNLQVAARPIEKETNTKQHARYLLGMKSGLHFDHGFDTNEDGSTNHIEWMSPSVLVPLLDKFT
jgi:hypothetical protein